MKFLLIIVSIFNLAIIGYSQYKNPIVVKGTWITSSASVAMYSKQNVIETVENCKKNGLTDIFVVVWNDGVTMYPSPLVKSYTGILQDTNFKNFDPLLAFVEQGHKLGLRVHAWFEFGFSYAYKDSSKNKWLEKYPDWVGRNSKGELLKKNGFFWWNAMNPAVQSFIKKLVLEVVNKYQVDGIQGDDRLPAMPSEGGYDALTIKMYQSENQGSLPPSDAKNAAWISWRANKLNDFAKNLYSSVKKINPNCLVTWAPSIYPWSKEQYLQDWPTWLKDGYADLIIPQVYRYKLDSYTQTLKAIATHLPSNSKYKIFPGILSSLGDGYRADSLMIQQMISLNRQEGYNGEVLFYYQTIKESKTPIYKNN